MFIYLMRMPHSPHGPGPARRYLLILGPTTNIDVQVNICTRGVWD